MIKPCHFAVAVSALAFTVIGVSINPVLQDVSGPAHHMKNDATGSAKNMVYRRGRIPGPLPRTLRRSQAAARLNQRNIKRNFIKRDLQNWQLQDSYSPSSTALVNDAYPKPAVVGQIRNRMEVSTPASAIADPSISSAMTPNDVPGFVEIAIPDQSAGVARTVSGLAYSPGSDSQNGEMELGTSPTHSTQFFLSRVGNVGGSTTYRLRAAIADPATQELVDHCATFPTSPPGPLSLKKCTPSSMSGFSQSFLYDSASGELQPVYTPASFFGPATGNQQATAGQVSQQQVASNCDQSSTKTSKRDGILPLPKSSAVLYFVSA